MNTAKVVFPKVSLQFSGIGYHWKVCFNPLLDVTQISIDKKDVPFVLLGHICICGHTSHASNNCVHNDMGNGYTIFNNTKKEVCNMCR